MLLIYSGLNNYYVMRTCCCLPSQRNYRLVLCSTKLPGHDNSRKAWALFVSNIKLLATIQQLFRGQVDIWDNVQVLYRGSKCPLKTSLIAKLYQNKVNARKVIINIIKILQSQGPPSSKAIYAAESYPLNEVSGSLQTIIPFGLNLNCRFFVVHL